MRKEHSRIEFLLAVLLVVPASVAWAAVSSTEDDGAEPVGASEAAVNSGELKAADAIAEDAAAVDADELGELRERMSRLDREAAELKAAMVKAKEAGRVEEARERAAALEKISAELEKNRVLVRQLSMKRPDLADEDKQSARSFDARLAELRARLAKAKEAGREEQARDAIVALEKLQQEQEQKRLQHPLPEKDAAFQDRLRAMQSEVSRRRDALIRERELAQAREARPGDAEREQAAQIRIRTLLEAAEQVQRAGLPDLAHELRQRAEHAEREFQAMQHQQSSGRHESDEALRELSEQMEQMRNEVRELHRKLDRLMELVQGAQRQQR